MKKETLLQASREYDEFDVLGDTCRIRSLTEREYQWANRNVYKSGEVDHTQVHMATLKLIVLSVVDESGNRVFNDEDYKLLLDAPASAIDAIGRRVKEINKLVDADEAEELAGN